MRTVKTITGDYVTPEQNFRAFAYMKSGMFVAFSTMLFGIGAWRSLSDLDASPEAIPAVANDHAIDPSTSTLIDGVPTPNLDSGSSWPVRSEYLGGGLALLAGVGLFVAARRCQDREE